MQESILPGKHAAAFTEIQFPQDNIDRLLFQYLAKPADDLPCNTLLLVLLSKSVVFTSTLYLAQDLK